MKVACTVIMETTEEIERRKQKNKQRGKRREDQRSRETPQQKKARRDERNERTARDQEHDRKETPEEKQFQLCPDKEFPFVYLLAGQPGWHRKESRDKDDQSRSLLFAFCGIAAIGVNGTTILSVIHTP